MSILSSIPPKTFKVLIITAPFSCLKNSAAQFYKREGDRCYLLAGYPWYHASAREEFFATPSCTLDIDRPEYWDAIIDKTAIGEVRTFMDQQMNRCMGVESLQNDSLRLRGMDEPDALLWLIRAFQKYAHKYTIEDAAKKYGTLCVEIIDFYRTLVTIKTFFQQFEKRTLS